MKVLRLFWISRPALWINTLGVAITALWLSGHLYTTRWDFWMVMLWLTLPFNLLIYGINDIFDQAEDAINPRKGGLQGARIYPEDVKLILWAVGILNVPFLVYFALSIPWQALAWMLFYAVIFVGYSAKPVRFKARPYWDALSNAAYAFPMAFVPLLMGSDIPWWAFVGTMAWSVGKQAFDAIQDIPHDHKVGIVNTAVKLGVQGTMVWSACWYTVALLCFGVESEVVAATVALVNGRLLYLLSQKPTPEQARKLYPSSMLSPLYIGTVAGVLLVASLVRG